MCLAGSGTSLSETELSGVGSRADVALGHPCNDHLSPPSVAVGDKGASVATASAWSGSAARMTTTSAARTTSTSAARTTTTPAARTTTTSAASTAARWVSRTEVSSAAHDGEPWRGAGTVASLVDASPSSTFVSSRMVVARETKVSPNYLVTPAPAGDVDLVVAETSSESGSNPAYSLVVRRPLCMATSPVGIMRSYHQGVALPGVGQRLMEVGECSNKSQEAGPIRVDGLKELSHKTDVRLVSSSTACTTKNCLVWLNNEKLKAYRIWNSGKKVGYSRFGNEDDILNKLKSLEERDNGKEGVGWDEHFVVNDETH